jgi:light-regulated signal transduction histidine kinase (bacteriophytochrome)
MTLTLQDVYAANILDTVRQPLLLLSADLRVVTANPAFYEMCHLTPAETEHQLVYELGRGEWQEPHLRQLLEEILPESIELRDFELRQNLPGLGQRTMLLNARLLHQADGAVEMILLAIEDVTERLRLAQQLNETLRELERRNRELQDFASIASHDLQEPLRKIRAFSDRLSVACGDALPAEGRDYLARIQSAAGRMSTLIADLLSLTRVMTRGKAFERADLRKIAAAVVIDLEEAIASGGATVVIGDLASVHADPTQMRQLLQNLIGNAIKFRSPQAPAVNVYTERLADGCRLIVEDNGIGFAAEHAERIFDPFERLHGRGEYEGTGIGLALCRRIMERHGGTIHAVSPPEGGAQFIATFPALERNT